MPAPTPKPVAQPTLSLSDQELDLAGRLLTTFLRDYEHSIPVPHIVPELDRTALAELAQQPFAEDGVGVAQLFDEITDKVVPNSTAVAHPRFLGYVLGPPNGIAPYAEAIAAAINQNCNFWQLSPAASVIERAVINWLSGLFGYPASAGGLFTSGGSMATLTAMVTAINQQRPEVRGRGMQAQPAPLVVYASEDAHGCVNKDAMILGLGLDNVRKVPVDGQRRMRPDRLLAAIHADRAAGKEPFCVVATAGTVTTGAIDPIDTIADLCHDEGLWLHVDGAYGALFLLSERRRHLLLPCGRADSVALDPHKLLFAPLEAGCLLVRDRDKARRAFGFPSPYLTVAQDPLMVDFMDYGPQLSRGFKAFKVWCALRAFGVAAFRAAIDHTLDLAQYMADRIRSEPMLELMAPVHLTAICFRAGNADQGTHTKLLAQLVEDGTALLGPVSLGGRSGLRACITNYRTTRADIDLVVDEVVRIAATH